MNPPTGKPAEAAHRASLRSPMTALFFFGVPFVTIVSLVALLLAPAQPSGNFADSAAAKQHAEAAVTARIQKVGAVALKDGARKLVSGEEVFKAQCSACHTAGVAGAPKYSDAAAWGPRIASGFEALLASALKGKGAMGAQGGGNFEDLEVARAVVYLANAGGAKFAEPAAKAEAGDPAPAASAAPAK